MFCMASSAYHSILRLYIISPDAAICEWGCGEGENEEKVTKLLQS